MSGAVDRPALVVFRGDADLWWQWLLKPGFRHCFVCLNDGRHWLVVDPLSCGLEVGVLTVAAEVDLAAWLRRHALTVVAVRPTRLRRPLPPGLLTCVETVKRVLGLSAPLVVTPWQLYRHLMRLAPAAGPSPPHPAASPNPNPNPNPFCQQE